MLSGPSSIRGWSASEAATAAVQAQRGRLLEMERLQDSLDSLLAAECCLCGHTMVESVSKPLLDVLSPEMDLWAI